MNARILYIFAILACCLCLCACQEESLPPGTIASVNGEPISLQSAQTLMDSRSAALGIPPRPSVAEARENYRQALAILIAHALARQELAARGLEISEKELNDEIDQIKRDYGDAGFDDFLAEASLREDEWRQLVRDYLVLRAFESRILLPSIKIPLEEAQAYYEEHKESFQLPASVYACQAGASSREALEAWCESLREPEFDPGPAGQCADILPQEIPDPWRDEMKKLKPGSCGKIIETDGQWRVMALIDRYSARTPGLAEVYALVESALLREKKLAAFNDWLTRKMAASKILASPALFPESGAPAGRQVFEQAAP